MLKNYFSVALRNILKQKVYSLINIVGLSIGLTSCILIFLYVEDEYSFDNFHDNSKNIYKVFLERIYPDHTTNYAVIPHSFANVLASDIPEVEQTVRLASNNNNPIQVTYVNEQNERISFEELDFILSDSNFFDIFSIKMISGEPKKALSRPQSVILTESTAKKYFGDNDPLGKSIQSDFGEFRVVGICEDVPPNSHFNFTFLASISSVPFFNAENYTGFSAHTYVQLVDKANAELVNEKFHELVQKYAAPQIEQNLNMSYADYVAAGNGYNYKLTNIRDIHLDPINYQLSFKQGGNKNDVFIFISIALLILIIACINFMNLSIARSTERGKEVGIRKALGSTKKQLIGQFLTESIILSILSLLVAVLFVFLALPSFNIMVQKTLSLNLDNSLVLPGLLIFSVFVGILAGSYPAFILSSYNPILVLKGRMKGNSNSWLRNSLVVLQFTISIILILSTLIIHDQLEFIQSKDLGFDRENIIIIERAGVLQDQQNSFNNEIKNIPGVVKVGGSNTIPAGQYFGMQFLPEGGGEVITTNGMIVNDDFLDAMSFDLVEGEGFSKDRNDSLYIIINQETAKLMGNTDVIGKTLYSTFNNPTIPIPVKVLGVVKNFHYMSLRDEISPFVLLSNETFGGGAFAPTAFISVKVSGDYGPILKEMEDQWKQMIPEEPFKYSFLDSELDKLYTNEANSGQKITAFASLAIIIACIGLFGLSAYTAGLRTKEIGVRKVMGATVGRVVLLLTMDFTRLVLIAFIFAVPLGWYSMNKWLDSFIYKTEMNFMNFIWAGLATLLVAWLTVSFQSIRAARINPVRSLRSE